MHSEAGDMLDEERRSPIESTMGAHGFGTTRFAAQSCKKGLNFRSQMNAKSWNLPHSRDGSGAER
jgi:hypothetical protein